MEIAEIRLHCVKQQDILFTPLIQALLLYSFFKDTEQHLTHEHCDGVLIDIVSDPEKRVSGYKILCSIQSGLGRLDNACLQESQWQEQGHQ